jgi:hypothetical protein
MVTFSSYLKDMSLRLFKNIVEIIVFFFSKNPNEHYTLQEQILIDNTHNNVIRLRGPLYPKESIEVNNDFKKYRLPAIQTSAIKAQFYGLINVIFGQNKFILDDVTLASHINNTTFGKPVNGIIDLTYFKDIPPMPGFYNAATKAFFNDKNEVIKIIIDGHDLNPNSKNWFVAKSFFWSNLYHHTLLYTHGAQHGNQNTVAVFSRKYLNDMSPIKKFLLPHFRFQPAWDRLVFDTLFLDHNNPASLNMYSFDNGAKIMYNGQNYLHTHESLSNPLSYNTNFYQALNAGYPVFANLVQDFIDKNENLITDDVRTWTNEIHKLIPYFPSGQELDIDKLKLVLTFIIWDTSFRHSLEHISVNNVMPVYAPFMIRTSFDPNRNYTIGDLYNKLDLFKNTNFIRTFTIEPYIKLIDLEYDPELNIDTIKFRNELADLQTKYPKFVDLNLISVSNDI